MDNWQRNQEIINKGGGSEQVRAHNRICDCLICNNEGSERLTDEDDEDC